MCLMLVAEKNCAAHFELDLFSKPCGFFICCVIFGEYKITCVQRHSCAQVMCNLFCCITCLGLYFETAPKAVKNGKWKRHVFIIQLSKVCTTCSLFHHPNNKSFIYVS